MAVRVALKAADERVPADGRQVELVLVAEVEGAHGTSRRRHAEAMAGGSVTVTGCHPCQLGSTRKTPRPVSCAREGKENGRLGRR